MVSKIRTIATKIVLALTLTGCMNIIKGSTAVLRALAVTALITFSLSGCVYGQFGNPSITDQSKVAQVKVGQTKEQVQQILGKPTGTQFTTNNDEIWVYTYSYTKEILLATTYTYRLSVLFDKGGIVKNISTGAQ